MMKPWLLRMRKPLINIKWRMELLAGKFDQFEGFIPFADGLLEAKYVHVRDENGVDVLTLKHYQWDALRDRWIDVSKIFEGRISNL